MHCVRDRHPALFFLSPAKHTMQLVMVGQRDIVGFKYHIIDYLDVLGALDLLRIIRILMLYNPVSQALATGQM